MPGAMSSACMTAPNSPVRSKGRSSGEIFFEEYFCATLNSSTISSLGLLLPSRFLVMRVSSLSYIVAIFRLILRRKRLFTLGAAASSYSLQVLLMSKRNVPFSLEAYSRISVASDVEDKSQRQRSDRYVSSPLRHISLVVLPTKDLGNRYPLRSGCFCL